ncbi:hypothetical protein [Actinomadura monticuli]|uniref:Uncharacterized protein n=1 Tax=Actinomadura monticuli TaxID=3097367 RepID=A0ABV4Q6C1_9ACTN
MSWSEETGMVSRAFDDWRLTDRDIRAFLTLAVQWAERSYQEEWQKAEATLSAVFDPDVHYGDEHVDMFHRSVGGLWPDDFEWIIRGTVVKEAVTAFEVYLDKAAQEALDRYRWTDDAGQKHRMVLRKLQTWQTPGWDVLVRFHAELGNEIQPERVKFIRDLRHLLTHQRGELRTEEQRARFADDHVIAYAKDSSKHADIWDEASVGGQVQLRHERVMAILHDLGAVVRAADPVIWSIRWDNGTLPDPDILRSRKLIQMLPA